VSQSSRIELSAGALNGADRLTIELMEPPRPATDGGDQLASQPTMCTPAQLDAVVAVTMNILAASVIELAALKVWKNCERRAAGKAAASKMSRSCSGGTLPVPPSSASASSRGLERLAGSRWGN
jgi:hypothetical protein